MNFCCYCVPAKYLDKFAVLFLKHSRQEMSFEMNWTNKSLSRDTTKRQSEDEQWRRFLTTVFLVFLADQFSKWVRKTKNWSYEKNKQRSEEGTHTSWANNARAIFNLLKVVIQNRMWCSSESRQQALTSVLFTFISVVFPFPLFILKMKSSTCSLDASPTFLSKEVLVTGVYPHALKTAAVKPFLKITLSNPSVLNNNLPFLGKTLAHAVLKQLDVFLHLVKYIILQFAQILKTFKSSFSSN